MRKILVSSLLLLPFLSCAQVPERPEPPSNAGVIVEEPTTDEVAAATKALQDAMATLQALTNPPSAESLGPGNPNRTLMVYGIPTTGGHTAGSGTYPRYTYVQFSAVPNAGWYLKSWNDGNTNLVRAIVLKQSVTFTATFTQTPPSPTTSLVTVGWNGVAGCSNYYVSYGPSTQNYTKRVTANSQTKKQLTVGLPSTNYIAVQAIDGVTGLVSAYSAELFYSVP
jgi:hypothetical protein